MDDLFITAHIIIPASELVITTSRASGPGGQHVNKTSSRVSLRWNIAQTQSLNESEKAIILARLRYRLVGEEEILIHVDSERSQLRNRKIACERLALLIKNALIPTKPRIDTKPTLSSKKRRMEGKRRRGVIKKLRKFVNDD